VLFCNNDALVLHSCMRNCILKPRLRDTTCCQTGLTTGCIVYTAGCQTGCTTRFDNRLNEQRLFVQHGCQSGCQLVSQPVWQPVVSCKRGRKPILCSMSVDLIMSSTSGYRLLRCEVLALLAAFCIHNQSTVVVDLLLYLVTWRHG